MAVRKKSPAARVKAPAKKVAAKVKGAAGGEYKIVETEDQWICFQKRSGRWVEHRRFDTEDEAERHYRFEHQPPSPPVLLASGSGKKEAPEKRVRNVRPDTLDFRDQMYKSTLKEVPAEIKLETYRKWKVPVLDQGTEGACTGYGLATVANYLLLSRSVKLRFSPVSPKMLYQLAKRYDEWAGENYDGSSARGAMKGWHKHGVCKDTLWRNTTTNNALTAERVRDALERPLGAYYRVNHKDLVAMHSAMAEVGVLFATCVTHSGWDKVGRDGTISFESGAEGGHAFAIVAYNRQGFWIQNSWGAIWGKSGFALITYDDWLQNGIDVWVARLGVPVTLLNNESVAISNSPAAKKSNSYSFAQLRPHVINIGNNGVLKTSGEYGNSEEEVQSIFDSDFETITKSWRRKRLLLYAHGGLVSEESAIQRVADYRAQLLDAEVYPLAFVWNSDAWSTITNILKESVKKRKPEGFLDAAKDFMLNRLDDILEPIARKLTGKMQWDKMKENAALATRSKSGGIRLALHHIADLAARHKNLEIHLIGHSAGSIVLGYLVDYLSKNDEGVKLDIESCTLWAPACTVDLFNSTYLPAIKNEKIKRFSVFNLTDAAENDDHCAHIYNKSLLYLVSNAFEDKVRIPGIVHDGTPLLGMEKFIKKDKSLSKLLNVADGTLVLSPNAEERNSDRYSNCTTHGGFDDDNATVTATLCRILNKKQFKYPGTFTFQRSQSSLKDRREALDAASSEGK
ncbi:MAG: C1 family peptidase [Chitinophagaceae bacterium]|nr:C1 family peptidase [Chitinophagaceae bacterium]MCW5926156.1 C1 family peptidase [Chitinophagaceae bacterium]